MQYYQVLTKSGKFVIIESNLKLEQILVCFNACNHSTAQKIEGVDAADILEEDIKFSFNRYED